MYPTIFQDKKEYDILTLIDADNILDPNTLNELNNAHCAGYLVGNAYRRQLNEQGKNAEQELEEKTHTIMHEYLKNNSNYDFVSKQVKPFLKKEKS